MDTDGPFLSTLMEQGRFRPVLKQVGGNRHWVARIRIHGGRPVLHLLNTGLVAVPHSDLKDGAGVAVLKDIDALPGENYVSFQIDTSRVPLGSLCLRSPELEQQRSGEVPPGRDPHAVVRIDMTGVKMYGVVQAET